MNKKVTGYSRSPLKRRIIKFYETILTTIARLVTLDQSCYTTLTLTYHYENSQKGEKNNNLLL